MRLGLRAVVVSGDSMHPTLHSGDFCLVRQTRSIEPADIAVVRRPDRPDLLVVKRVVSRTPDGWWVTGDNPAASDDSRVFGVVPDDCVVGRVVWRYWPLVRRRSAYQA